MQKPTFKQLLTLCLAAALSAGVAQADIFSFVDEDGTRHFTNAPGKDPRYQLVIKSRETSPGFRYPGSKGAPAGRYAGKPFTRTAYDGVVRQAASQYNVDEALIRAVIHAESAFNPSAISPKGASGLMQLMPGTAARYGVTDIFDPVENVHAGVRYLSDLKKMFGNNLRLTLAAYNAGEGAVLRYGDIPPYPETIEYVSKVIDLQGRYSQAL